MNSDDGALRPGPECHVSLQHRARDLSEALTLK